MTKHLKLSVQKHTQIGKDWQRAGVRSHAYDHYKVAFDESKLFAEEHNDVHWQTLKNLVQICVKQNKANDAIELLSKYVAATQPNLHAPSLLCFASILIENQHSNAKCVLYRLCEVYNSSTEAMITCFLLKCAYFALTGNELRSSINFKKAIQLCPAEDTQQMQAAFDGFFDLHCYSIIDAILGKFKAYFFNRTLFDIHYYINNAKLYLGTKSFIAAMSAINEAIKMDDECARLWAIKGHIQYENEQINEAKQSYQRHLELCPGTTESLLPPPTDAATTQQTIDKLAIYRLGKIYDTQREYALSLQTYFQGIEYEPDSWLFWFEAGNALFALKDYKQCIECFKQSNLIHNNESHAWCMLALCHLALNETPKAIKLMHETLKFSAHEITDDDQHHIREFGQKLIDLGYVQSGTFFKHYQL